jgi:hypothetical protein
MSQPSHLLEFLSHLDMSYKEVLSCAKIHKRRGWREALCSRGGDLRMLSEEIQMFFPFPGIQVRRV